jgi:fibronectin type 3 domain-containing protein
VDDLTLELAGPFSQPVRVEAKDVFPPAAPKGLAAVAVAASGGDAAGVDLDWDPNTEADLAGYVVYRREADGDWERVSPTVLLVGPGFHDGHVVAGHAYEYAVTAVDQNGHESLRSAPTQEAVPAQ